MLTLSTVVGVILLATSAADGRRVESPANRTALRPNIVLVMTDDQRWDTVWAMPTVRDALAGHGVTFSNGFVVNAMCCPSRASVLTGRFSHSTGVYLNQGSRGGFASFDDSSTIATALHAAGYTTGLVGKYLNGYGVKGDGAGYIPPGWDAWTAFYSGFPGDGYYDYTLSVGRRVVRYGNEPYDYSTDVLRRRAVSFLRAAREPFFLEFAPYAPHGPATPPRRYENAFDELAWFRPPSFDEDLSDKPVYIQRGGPLARWELRNVTVYRRHQLEATLAVDDAVRAILEELEKRNVLGRTLIVFTSDNGVAWGEHSLVAGKKAVPYEESIRVPLVIRYDPMTRNEARVDESLALNIDLAPTLTALAGAHLNEVEGRSLLPLLRSDGRNDWRTEFLVEHLRGPPYQEVPTYCALRTNRYKYVLYQTHEEELYDLFVDPHEISNRADRKSMQAIKRALRARLAELCMPPPPGFTALRSTAGRP